MNIKRSLKILVLPVAMLITGISYADIVVYKPALDIQKMDDSSAVEVSLHEFKIDAIAFTILTDDAPIDILDTTFTLRSEGDFIGNDGYFKGTFSVGTLLTGLFDDLYVHSLGGPDFGFEGDLIYDGGSLMGDLTGGSLKGTFINSNVLAELGQVAVVPVPAAVWLFGSGLIGLVGVARRKA